MESKTAQLAHKIATDPTYRADFDANPQQAIAAAGIDPNEIESTSLATILGKVSKLAASSQEKGSKLDIAAILLDGWFGSASTRLPAPTEA